MVRFYAALSLFLLASLAPTFSVSASSESEWYITHLPISAKDFRHEEEVKQMFLRSVRECLTDASSISQVAHLKREIENKLWVSIFDPRINGGGTKAVRRVENPALQNTELTPQQTNGLQLALYGLDGKNDPRRGAAFVYVMPWRAILLPARKMWKPVFCGRMVHEIYHASEHSKRGRSGRKQAPYPAPEWIDEEVYAHELNGRVTDVLTGGRYLAPIKQYVLQHKEYGPVELAQALSRTGPFPEFGSLFPPCSEDELSTRIGQVVMDALFLSIDTKGGSPEEKRRAFRIVYDNYMRQ